MKTKGSPAAGGTACGAKRASPSDAKVVAKSGADGNPLLEDWIDRARLVNLDDVVHQYGIRLSGLRSWRAGPCPRCGGRDRFVVRLNKQTFYCRRCREGGGDAIALVCFIEDLDPRRDFLRAVEIATGEPRPDGKSAPDPERERRLAERRAEWERRRVEEERAEEERERRNGENALSIWDEAKPVKGSLAECYLRGRGIDVAQLPQGALRFHPRCIFGKQTWHPCLVALFQHVETNEPTGIHRIALTSDGQKIDRKMLGPVFGSAIKLWPDEEITMGLVVGEGVETVAAAATRVKHRGTLLRPAWALASDGGITELPVLPGIECLTILVDNDEAGREAAGECLHRWRAAEREATALVPTVAGEDFNDIARRIK
jgi:hypothetical protein